MCLCVWQGWGGAGGGRMGRSPHFPLTLLFFLPAPEFCLAVALSASVCGGKWLLPHILCLSYSAAYRKRHVPRVSQSLVFNTQGGLWNLENLILFLVNTWLWQLIPIAFIDSTLFRTLKSQGRAVTSWFSAVGASASMARGWGGNKTCAG